MDTDDMEATDMKTRTETDKAAGWFSGPVYQDHLKRYLDLVLAFEVLIFFWWLFPLCGAAVKIEDPSGPVLFRQERIGKDGKVYQMLKFRSMKVGSEHTGSGVYSEKGDPRVTRVGRIIRATSLDEIPQLYNIIRGEMSFVGPRSPLTYHPWPWEEYTKEQRKMFRVRPGLTGWAQVHGRKRVEWHRRIEMNVWYAKHVSLPLDMKIALMTVFKILLNEDNENVGKTLTDRKTD